jgi:type III restriction enzyme
VNQSGDRVRDERVNVLTVVANESYEHYVDRYQVELAEACGADGVPPKPADARKRAVAKLRKNYTLKPEFKELWNRIKHKTRYAVKIDTEKLLADVVADLNKATIRPPQLVMRKAVVQVDDEADILKAVRVGERSAAAPVRDGARPNLVAIMSDLMERTTPPVRLTRATLLAVYQRSKQQKAALENPHEFATVAVQIIKAKLMDQLVEGIQYERVNEWYEMSQFLPEIATWTEYVIPAAHSVYDQVIFDSDIERDFVKGLELDDRVKLYLKLPDWFTVPTPVGEYNPDWAIVMEQRDEHGKPAGADCLYLVRETKATADVTKLRPDEARKIHCGKRHFRDGLGVDYSIITAAVGLP